MDAGKGRLGGRVEEVLWPLVETLVGSHHLAGAAVAIVRDGEVVSRGFGVRDAGTGEPVTPETMFHLASVSKPFVATAIASLAIPRADRAPVLDLDAPIVEWLPEFTLADGRAGEVTARHLLSHSSGLPDVADYGWHDPHFGDDALGEFARSLSGMRLKTEPGSAFSYSNAGFELLGLLLSRVMGTTFEDAVREQVLRPLGMRDSTFRRAEVPPRLAAAPHVGVPLSVPQGSYPYTRRHAPSSTLHSNLVELCLWMRAHLQATDADRAEPAPVDARLLELMWRPAVPVNDPPWEDDAALGWFVGTYHGHRTLSHSGADPGFGCKLVLVPDRRTGVVVLANSNTAPAWAIAPAALDIALDDIALDDIALDDIALDDIALDDIALEDGGLSAIPDPTRANQGNAVAALGAMLPPVVGPVAEALASAGEEAAKAEYHRLAAADPAQVDVDDWRFVDAVWGAIELHRTDLVWPLLRLWTVLRPDSSAAWTMTGWAHQVDGRPGPARSMLRRALDIDPDNRDAALILGDLPSA